MAGGERRATGGRPAAPAIGSSSLDGRRINAPPKSARSRTSYSKLGGYFGGRGRLTCGIEAYGRPACGRIGARTSLRAVRGRGSERAIGMGAQAGESVVARAGEGTDGRRGGRTYIHTTKVGACGRTFCRWGRPMNKRTCGEETKTRNNATRCAKADRIIFLHPTLTGSLVNSSGYIHKR